MRIIATIAALGFAAQMSQPTMRHNGLHIIPGHIERTAFIKYLLATNDLQQLITCGRNGGNPEPFDPRQATGCHAVTCVRVRLPHEKALRVS